ncbi:MAG: hypothetical protein AAB654_03045 [Acidobacteriota bacterium]
MANYVESARRALAAARTAQRGEKIEAAPPKSDALQGIGPTKTEPDQAAINQATALLNAAGVRLMRLGGVSTVGVWSDLDGPEIRAALRTLQMDSLPVRFLDGDGIPLRYTVRRVRERRRGVSWAEWKATALTQLL